MRTDIDNQCRWRYHDLATIWRTITHAYDNNHQTVCLRSAAQQPCLLIFIVRLAHSWPNCRQRIGNKQRSRQRGNDNQRASINV